MRLIYVLGSSHPGKVIEAGTVDSCSFVAPTCYQSSYGGNRKRTFRPTRTFIREGDQFVCRGGGMPCHFPRMKVLRHRSQYRGDNTITCLHLDGGTGYMCILYHSGHTSSIVSKTLVYQQQGGTRSQGLCPLLLPATRWTYILNGKTTGTPPFNFAPFQSKARSSHAHQNPGGSANGDGRLQKLRTEGTSPGKGVRIALGAWRSVFIVKADAVVVRHICLSRKQTHCSVHV